MSVEKRRRDLQRRKNQLKAACAVTGKRRFRSEEAAQRALEDAAWWRERGDDKRQEKRAYLCPHCAGFHLTSKPALPKSRPVPVKAVSVKRAKEQRQRTKMLRDTFGANPDCARCGQPADDAHELLSRARGGSITDPTNVIPACRSCHTWITENPLAASAEGWLRSAGEAS